MSVFGEILPIAIGLAMLGVMPMIATVVLISSQGGTGKAWAFAGGYFVAVAAVTILFVAIGDRVESIDGPTQSTTLRSLFQVAVGLLLLVLSYRNFQKRKDPNTDGPAWLAKVDQLSTGRALGLGLVTGSVNPKNLALIPGAAVSIVAAELSFSGELVTSLVFALIGSAGLVIPLIIPIVSGARADQVLNALRRWLTSNSAVIMMVLLFILGWVLIGRGISGLSAS